MRIQNIHSLPEGRLPCPQPGDTSHHDGVDRMMRDVWFSCQSCPGRFLHCVCVVTVVRTCSSAVMCKPTSRPVSSFLD